MLAGRAPVSALLSSRLPDRRKIGLIGCVLGSNRHLGFRALMRTSARMAAYRCISARIPDRGCLQRRYEIPANRHIRCRSGLEVGLIAMQKVEGSNPFSRFASNPL
jgi:hypothetical protein